MRIKNWLRLLFLFALIIIAMNPHRAKDGMELIYIPAGEAWVGSGEWDHDYSNDEILEHKVYLDSFCIYKTEVTNNMYAQCVNVGICDQPCSEEMNPRFKDPQYANHPVVYVSWQDAMDYCAWVGGRLPTEAEWEKAARGTDKRIFPWGEDNPSAENVNAANMVGDTMMVGSYPEGASPYGVLDLSGNVREWVIEWYDTEETLKVLKGGSFLDDYSHVRIADRLGHDPNSAGFNRGFRCVIPAEKSHDTIMHTRKR